jgi:glycolate oxidase FAD binding subunit
MAAAVRAAAAADLALLPAGNATHLHIGAAPRRYDAAVSTRRMTQVIAHDAGDLTVTAEAGVTIEALGAMLAAQGQWLPIDPPRADAMTIGGLIAADRSGPQRLAYGKVRDLVIGLQVVLADGALVRGGGRVVKNVAGYDLPKLFAGSYGTLGVIVEATFKVRPLPESEALFLWPQASIGAALEAGRALLGGGVFPVFLEATNDAAGETLGLDAGACLAVGIAGAASHIAEQARRLQALSVGAVQPADGERGVALRRALREFSQPASEDAIVVRLSSLPSDLPELVARLEADAARSDVVAEIAAHAGSGVAWCQLLGAASADRVVQVIEQLRAAATARGAWVICEALPAELRGRVDPWGFAAPSLRLMRGVKQALDPQGRFSPGRFVGGI